MDAFKKVDSANLKPVYKSDAQGSWQAFKQDGKNLPKKKVGSTPFFPKLGQATAIDDDSNYTLGKEDKVRAPELYAEKPGAKKQRIQETAEPSISKPKQVSSSSEQQWTQLVEPDTNKVYWFNSSLGEVSYQDPNIQDQNDNSSVPEQSVIQSDIELSTESTHKEPLEGKSSAERAKIAMQQVQQAIERQKTQGNTMTSSEQSNMEAKRKLWRSTTDPKTSRKYWYHVDTKEVQWGPPRGDQLS